MKKLLIIGLILISVVSYGQAVTDVGYANPYEVAPGDQTEFVLTGFSRNEVIICIIVTTGSFQVNVNGAITANSGTLTADSRTDLIYITIPRGNKLNLKAGSDDSEAIIFW